LKTQIIGAFDQIVSNALKKLGSFSFSFVGENGGRRSNSNILRNASEIKERLGSMFSGDWIEQAKKRIEDMIARSARMFEKLEIEEIQFLIMRFCQLAGEIERVFSDSMKPLDNIRNRHSEVLERLSASGNPATARAIAAGARRFDRGVLQSLVNAQRQIPGRNGISIAQFEDIARGRSVAPASFSSRGAILAAPDLLPEEIERATSFYTWENVRNEGSNPFLGLSFNISNESDREVWTTANGNVPGVQIREKVLLIRFAERWVRDGGSKIIVTSAYRSPARNARTPGGVSRSLHLTGRAFDIRFRGQNKEKLMEYARQGGFRVFTGNPPYQSHIHIDTSGR
jgi:hypothetical protein